VPGFCEDTGYIMKYRPGIRNFFSSTRAIVVSLFASEHRHKMSARKSTIYKYVKGHYPISKEYRGAREHQVKNPWIYLTVICTIVRLYNFS
jgi:hypothetical protein